MNQETRKIILEIVFVLTLVIIWVVGTRFFEWYAVLVVFAVACISYITIMCTRCQRKISDLDYTIKVRLGQLKGLQDYLSGDLGIVEIDELVAFEKTVKEEVWIATYDLTYDLESFLDVGVYNLQRGIIYKYFIPPDLEITFKELQKKILTKLKNKDLIKQHQVKYIKREYMPLNIVLYDPMSEKHGYLYVPETKSNFFIKFDLSSFQQIRNYFYFLMKLEE